MDTSAFVQCTNDDDCGPGSVCTDDGLCIGQGPEGDEPGECSDGADNDMDGLFDCDDDGCAGSPNCTGDDDTTADDDDTSDDDDVGDDDASDDDDTGDDDASDDDDDDLR